LDRTSPHLVFLFSDTGGGHRSAAEAIISALGQGFPGQFTYDMVDIFRDYAPALLDRIPDIYPSLSRNPKLLGQIFYLSDDPRRIRKILKILYPYIRTSLDRFLAERPADLFVSVHPLINIPLGSALEKRGSTVPVVTVVTDLVSAHTTWFTSRANSIVVPTQQAFQVGLKAGIPPDHMKVIGLPVADGFAREAEARAAIRSRLGWPTADPVVLLMGGGEGMGNLDGIAAALDDSRLPVTLVIIAGRNESLRQRMEARQWNVPVRVYGFVREMPD
jgi:1,2-diacylglycerol 3-beta-galactosyltransferase